MAARAAFCQGPDVRMRAPGQFTRARGIGPLMSRPRSRVRLVATSLLLASLAPASSAAASSPIRFHGRVSEPGATVQLRTVDASGHASAPFGPFTAGPDGALTGMIPAAATRGVPLGEDHRATLRLETTGGAQLGTVTVSDPPDRPVLGNHCGPSARR